MKLYQLIFTTITLSGLSYAQTTILDNDFSSGDGTYSGPSGEAYGAAAELGNATTNRNTAIGSGLLTNSGNEFYGFRSRGTSDITTLTTFSMDFVFNEVTLASGDSNDGLFGLGWGTDTAGSADTDGAGLFNGGTVLNLGLAAAGDGSTSIQNTSVTFYAFDSGINAAADSAQGGSMSLTDGNTYRFSFEIAYNNPDDNWDITNLSLFDVTGASSVGSIAAINDLSGNIGTLTTDGIGYATIFGSSDRGFQAVDSITVTAIPEPSTFVLMGLTALAGLFILRRR